MITKILLAFSLSGSTWVLYLLVVLSIVSVAIIIGKIRFFRKNKIDFELFTSRLYSALEQGGVDGLKGILASFDSSEAKIISAVLEPPKNPGLSRKELLQEALFRERLKMEKGLSFLGTLGNNAPFIGLFGTVLGIIKAFHDLAIKGGGGPSVVMAGISEALIATAIGLLIAIPAVIAYNYFQRKIKVRLGFAEMTARNLIAVLEKEDAE
jgi:biopolymer transport protein ExbB